MRPLITFAGVAAFVMLMVTTQNVAAQDNSAYGTDRADAKFVGVTGGAVLGAEIVMVVQAAVGVDKVWPYIVFPVLGAGGGGVGGFFLEKKSVPGSVALLAAGIAFLIPSAIITSNAFAYNPEKEGALDEGSDPGSRLSFELPPDTEESDEPLPKEEGSVTEVESKPDVGPPGPVTLPPPGEPVEAPTEEEPATEAPAETPPAEAPAEENGAETEEAAPQATNYQHSRPVFAMGSLFNVDARSGRSGFGIPAPHVTPIQLRSENGFLQSRKGVQVVVPMIYVALP